MTGSEHAEERTQDEHPGAEAGDLAPAGPTLQYGLQLLDEVDRRTTTVLLSSVILMTLYIYQGAPAYFDLHLAPLLTEASILTWIPGETLRRIYQFSAMLFLFGVVPALLAKRPMRMSLRDLGVRLGDWRFGGKVLLIGIPLLIPFLFMAANQPDMQAEYPMSKLAGSSVTHFVLYELAYGMYYIGWEFFFRGFMLFGLRDRFGDLAAILIQTIPSTIIHIGKPNAETAAAIAAGLAFGFIALRTRSILYVLILHWFVGSCTDFFCVTVG